ncbi:rab3 GTPase-activating protein non-catalytic subunit isoform X1 [Anabrus simplex]|uniref:rab3 GTPase-activating protein non-catalytic subunit isoform X1 n=1 Tax=Anabrus simplex TaxID=316456 RepID=UPI0035A3A25B
MSCLIKPFANIVDVETVKRRLFGIEYPVGKEWLQECQVALSSMGDHLIITHEKVMVILKSKWDSQEEVKTKYHIVWHGTPCKEDNEEITAVLCLPLIPVGKSTQCGPDWTCIVLGFSSGFVRFYTETSNLLVEEMLHNEPVMHLKCQAFQQTRMPTLQEQAEEVYVVYPGAVCVLPGLGLFHTLRACRNQVARVKANCGVEFRPPPLLYKKWGFQEQAMVADCEMAGLATASSFNHLMTTSLCQDFGAFYRSSAPQMSLVVAVGRRPFVGFHYALEGGAQPVLMDMAKAMASKLKSAIGQAVPGWFSSGKKTNGVDKNKENLQTEPVDPMLCRFGLSDYLRNGEHIVMSPNRTLSAVSDSLNRVLLLDNQKGIAIRMWKGYRNAQCAWLEVQGETFQRSEAGRPCPRIALFLVIYSPNMNCIDVWGIQQGSRVASFSAEDTRNGRLMYVGYGFMGMDSSPLRDGNRSQFPCVFMDPTGCLKEIVVPFHFALSAKDSKRTRDLHQLKELKRFLKCGDHNEDKLVEEVRQTMEELRTSEVRAQALETLASSRHSSPGALQAAVRTCLDKLEGQELTALDHADKALLHMAEQLNRLLAFYQFLEAQYQQPPDYSTVVADDLKSSQTLSSLLHAPEREVNNLLNLITTIDTIGGRSLGRLEPRVTFREDGRTAFVDFLSCFELGNSQSESGMIEVKKNVSEDKLKCISELMYQGTLYSDTGVGAWREAALLSRIQPLHLMRLALQFWLHKREGAALEAEMLRFCELLKAICSLTDVDVICAEYNELSSWWREIRTYLMESTNPFMALTSAIVCRAVALSVEKAKDLKHSKTPVVPVPAPEKTDNGGSGDSSQDMSMSPDDETHSSVSEWENVSRDTCQWTVLIGQLEDLALLDAVLKQKPWHGENDREHSSMSPHTCRLPYKRLSISLSDVLKKGKGSVAELVARWLSSFGLDPQLLVDLADTEFDNAEPTDKSVRGGVAEGEKMEVEEGSEASAANENQTRTLDLLAILKHHFPYSLSCSVLLGNLCWEFMFNWHQTPDKLEALEAAVSCLRAIPSPHMKHGLCSLVWAAHLKDRFESATRLLQKAGKVPKDRQCRQEVGISDLQLPAFLDTCYQFLDTFMDATVAMNVGRPATLPQYEDLWDCSVVGPPPLVEVALGQKPVNGQLLHLHTQLALALYMMAFFNLRLTRPLSTLFDNMGLAAFFVDLTSTPQLPSHNPDPKLLEARTLFLGRVVRSAMQTIRRDDSHEGKGVSLDAKLAIQWMSKCHLLADVWGVSSDILRRQQVCELYSNGFDRLAEEVIPAVSDPTALASQLLVIVGQRIRQAVLTSPNFRERVSRLSPSLYTWLNSLNEGAPPCILWSAGDTAQLLGQVVQSLPEEYAEYQLALHMLDAVSALQEDVAT